MKSVEGNFRNQSVSMLNLQRYFFEQMCVISHRLPETLDLSWKQRTLLMASFMSLFLRL